MSGLSVVFAGTPEFGIPALNALLSSAHTITAIYSQPDRPAGRGCRLQASPVKQWALEQNIPVFQPVNFKDPEAIEALRALKPDVMVVIAYGLILPQSVLDIPKLGCINVHASLLPRWRGASPIQHAILYGDKESGVTLMQMDSGMDTGAMLSKAVCEITPVETTASLHDKLALISAKPLVDVLNAAQANLLNPIVQDNSQATYAGKIRKEDAHIVWNMTAQEIDQRIRAYTPWPVAYTLLGDTVIRIHKARVTGHNHTQAPGTIRHLDKNGLEVATGSGSLLVEKIQFPGGKVITIYDYMNSGKNQLHSGLVLL